jgi:ribosomal protein L15
MKTWIKKILGHKPEEVSSTEINATDDYVIVNKKDLNAIMDELHELRSRNVSTDARELDLLLGNMEVENRKLKMDVEVLTSALRDATMNSRQ